MSAGGRPGIVLVAAIFVLTALALATAGLLLVSAQEMVLAETWTASVRARFAAETAARAVASAWRTRDYADLQPGESREASLPAASDALIRHSATVVRLADGLYLIRAGASVRAPSGGELARAQAGLLVATVTEPDLRGLLPGAATATRSARLLAHATVLGDGGDPGCTGVSAGAAPGLVVRDPASAAVDVGAELSGEPAILADATVADPITGPIRWETVEALADRIAAAVVEPGPDVQNGVCDVTDPSNWGDPLDPDSPCANHYPLIYAPGDLTVRGGAGQGLLVVRGTLRLEEGARFHGGILVGAALEIASGSDVVGAVRADTLVVDAGTISFSSCELRDVLRGSPGLGRPFRPGGRHWVPQF